MTQADNSSSETLNAFRDGVRSAVSGGGDIRAEVERLTREVLSGGRVDIERARAVAEAVGRGAAEGAQAAESPGSARRAMADAFAGLEGALLQSAHASKLALEEAAGKVGAFTERELRTAVHDLRSLEPVMLDSLSRAAEAGTDTSAEVLRDLVAHARRSGTTLGTEVETSMRALAAALPEAMRESVLAGLGAARESGARAADAASGMLGGVAAALRGKTDTDRSGGDT